MTQSVFEAHTGAFLSQDMWEAVIAYYKAHEAEYRSFKAFCRAYRRNRRGIAAEIQLAANIRRNVERAKSSAIIAVLQEQLTAAMAAAVGT